ncbi:kinase-like domain-containing protein [Gautieria morchelliformis]|nr:kinase-like domain-containing protein [Gautieria morchelliformis]
MEYSMGSVVGLMWHFTFNHFRRLAITYFYLYIKTWSLRIYGSTSSRRVIRLTKTTAFKRAFATSFEAETMRFISLNTSIPIPKVIDHWVMPQAGREGIIMEWIQGRTLKTVWPSLNDNQKFLLAEQLRGYISELRSLAQPEHLSGQIYSLNGGPCDDPLLLGRPCGPFDSELELNDFCLSRLAKFSWEPCTRAQIESVRGRLTADHRILFTHSDLTPRNILLDDQNNFVSILDKEMAGWRPEQWEYLKTMWMGQYDEDWPAFVHRVLPNYHGQLELHNEMCSMHGCPF